MSSPAPDRTPPIAPEQLPDGVACVLAPNPSLMTGPGTNSFLVWGPEAGCVVIDPGPDDADHLQALAAGGAQHGGVSGILITHGHPDHLEGAAALKALTGAPILAWSQEGAPSATMLLTDGASVAAGGRTLRALHTPGHRFDHLTFVLEAAGTAFVGDLVAGVGTVVIAPPEGDLADYMASLQRLRTLDARLLLPAHGPVISDPRTLLDYYIRHREERETQVLAALASGPRTVAALVTAIYADVDPALHEMAALSLTAHLIKLEREGRARSATDASGTTVWQLLER